MSAKDSPKHEALRRGNADYQWSDLDAEAYFNHYYGEPHPDDDKVVECAVEAIREAAPLDRELDIVDVGTGAISFHSFARCRGQDRLPFGNMHKTALSGSELNSRATRCGRSGCISGR